MKDNDPAIIVLNYNMPERTDAIVEHIKRTVKIDHWLIVVDNGSDVAPESKYTNCRTLENKQTTGGFLAGLSWAGLANCKYYWLIGTSVEFDPNDTKDPLAPMIAIMEANPDAYLVHPATTFNYSPWSQYMSPETGSGYRRIYNCDYIAPLFRAEYFDAIGRLRPELTYMWGAVGECNWKARKNGWKLFLCEDVVIHKETDIGYTMDRMNMTAAERRANASKQVDEIMIPIYGKDFRNKHWYEYTE